MSTQPMRVHLNPPAEVIVLPVPPRPRTEDDEVFSLWLEAVAICETTHRLAVASRCGPTVIRQCFERYQNCQANAIGWASR